MKFNIYIYSSGILRLWTSLDLRWHCRTHYKYSKAELEKIQYWTRPGDRLKLEKYCVFQVCTKLDNGEAS